MKNLQTVPVILLILMSIFFAPDNYAKEYIIYSIVQDIPMGYAGEIIKKNYFVDIGKQQGLGNGHVLDVFRTISQLDPYQNKKRYDHRIKIGTLKIIHAGDSSSVAKADSLRTDEDTPWVDVNGFMIGDTVNISLGKK